ncbi:NAD-dependent epimerase/dehydratase family protein [Burkholderia sp. 22PA0106]|uniref:NAD-dependent epimerase/dehydratase family protein n=1 Tax=Burkholderia sp. 22PA0106 TaxID=3237371 RepID=UPI0039C14976
MPMLSGMVDAVKAGQFRFVNHGEAVMSTAHVDNVCHAVELAIEKGRGGEAYFVSDGEARTFREVLAAFLDTQDVKSPTGSIPLRMAWIMAALMERLWKTLSRSGEPPITRQLLRLIGKDFTLDTTKAQGQLGYQPEVSWVEGIEAMKVHRHRMKY